MTDKDCDAIISAGSDTSVTGTDSSSTRRLGEIRKEISIQQSAGEKSTEVIGELLLEVKGLVKKDCKWTDWVKTNTDIPVYKAQRLMRVAKRFPKTTPESDLPFTHKYILTRIPSDLFDEFFNKEHEVETGEMKMARDMSKRELEKAVSNFLQSLGKAKEKPKPSNGINTLFSSEDSFESRMQSVNAKIDLLLSMAKDAKDSEIQQLQVMEFQSLCKKIYEAFPEASPDA